MTRISTYRLVAYDVKTGDEAFEWSNVADIARPMAGSEIEHEGKTWRVVGIRHSSPDVHMIDVRK
jgi:hypothetical protein